MTNMYTLTAKPLLRVLKNLQHILEVGAKHAETGGYDGERLTALRLAPDMQTLAQQVYVAGDISKGALARLSGTKAPVFEDVETTFADLIARLDRTIEFMSGISEDDVNGTEEKEIVMKLGSGNYEFVGLDYVQGFVIPNVLFHVTTVYAILRANGVALGKRDFFGGK